MAAQHIELENRCVFAHVFVFIFIAVSLWSLSMYSDIIASRKEYPQFYTNHLAFWLEISDFCTGLPYAVLLERPNSYESASVSCSVVWLFVTPRTVAYRIPLSMEFSRQEYWSGLPFSSPRYLSDPGIEPRSPALQADSESQEKLKMLCMAHQNWEFESKDQDPECIHKSAATWWKSAASSVAVLVLQLNRSWKINLKQSWVCKYK